MSDYVYVPRVAAESDVFTNGLIVASKNGIGDYRIGYAANSAYDIRLGLYSENNNLYFVLASNGLINDVEIYLVSPASTTLFIVTSITKLYESGYYTADSYTIVPDNTACIVFDTLSDTLNAMINPIPGPDSGVVVTANASPVYTPPSTEGVIVTAIARLLDTNQQGGTSNIGGGNGTFDDTSDVIPVSPLPDISAAQSGLVTLFKPSLAELNQLSSYLWTNITDFIENLNKLFMNPMDYLIALTIFPCNPEVGTRRAIKIGSFTTSIQMYPINSQWYEFNCGEVVINEYWGSALDYSPYTKISLFLPFIGSVQLNTDEVMGKRLGVKYRIDLLSGQCVAMVSVGGLNVQTSVLYQYTGECSVSVPLTGADWSRVYSAVIGAVGTAITGGIAAGAAGVAAGGATSALAGATAANAVGNVGQAYAAINASSRNIRGVQAMRENMQAATQLALDAGREAANAPGRVANGVRSSRIANTVNNTVGAVMSGKGAISHSGTISGSAGMLGIKVPYLLIEFPNQSLADNYKHFVGYPSNITETLGNLSGYTEVEQVIASGFGGITDVEMGELLEILKGGVYL